MKPQRLTGKSARITGRAAGIGAAIVRRFVAEGARVLVGDRDQPHGEALCAELSETVRALRPFRGDDHPAFRDEVLPQFRHDAAPVGIRLDVMRAVRPAPP